MADKQRDAARKELAWLETDLIRRRKKLAFWTECKARAEADPTMSQAKREGALYFFEAAQKLVSSGEKLRAHLVAEIQDQPEHQPAYHYAH
ncbi:hypothetical protein [Rhizobium sp. BR 314]|uniref:hypothetical protein n=1 Tax=Rhizobium sp. BR 314 TaxID=3040013 RepID=UPI0039BFB825